MIKTTLKLVKIGSSSGVILPAKDLKKLGVKNGATMRVSFEVAAQQDPQAELMSAYEKFKKQYSTTLKNLNNR